MTTISGSRFLLLCVTVVTIFTGILVKDAAGQTLPGKPSTEAIVEAPKESDLLGRDTPRGTMKGFMKAVAEENYVEAAEYMDLSKLSAKEKSRSAVLAQNLQRILDRQGWIKPDGELSDSPEGNKDDDLEPNMDSVASLRGQAEPTPILVERVTTKDDKQIWLISSAFVEEIPALASQLQEQFIDKLMIGELNTFKIYGAGIGHWILMMGLYVIAYLVSGILARTLIRLVRRIFHQKKGGKALSEKNLVDDFETPVRLYAMVWIASLSAVFIGVSVIVRHAFMPLSMMIAWVAVGLFFWRLADTLVSMFERRMAAKERYNMTSALAFARRGLRFVSVLIIIILVLNSFGVDVTAGLAALGIGGIALALGAQKTLENFIGSLSIIADQPLHVGDFCKIGDVSGTVEDIGMRSTRLRTNDNTRVTIPNGDLSTQRIENFARRPRFLINRTMIIRYDATSQKLRAFVEKATAVFNAQEKIVKDGTMVRFLGFSDTGYEVQLWANVDTSDYNEFVKVQAEISLQIIDAARDLDLYFAIPSQTFLPAVDQTGMKPPSSDKEAIAHIRNLDVGEG